MTTVSYSTEPADGRALWPLMALAVAELAAQSPVHQDAQCVPTFSSERVGGRGTGRAKPRTEKVAASPSPAA